MTINFALSLTYAGIDLLQRVEDGWRRVGTASLLSADLAADLAALRRKGEALAPEGLRTKIVIPTEQIKYIALDTTQTTMGDVQSALQGATPYALDELAIDFERFGGRTHIAAVARETLQEAEDFAHAHGFNPVSFVAVPEPFTFRQEIFFGPTSVAATILGPNVTVDRDDFPVLLVGTRIKSHVLIVEQTGDTASAMGDLSYPADRIVAEYHPAARVTPAAPPLVSTSHPVAIPHLDPVIAEYHAIPAQVEVPLIAVAMPGSPKPVVLGGVVAATPKPVPAAARRSYVVPGAIAASLAIVSLSLWALYDPATEAGPAALSEMLSPDASVVDIAIAAPDQRPFDGTLPEDDSTLALGAPPAPLTSDTADPLLTDYQDAPAPLGQVMTPDQAAAAYASTGVWQRAERLVDLPAEVTTDLLAWPITGVPPERMDLPDLPSVMALATDLSFVPLANPPAADAVFDLDDEGFVRATPEGAATPDGAVVYAGLPDLPFRERPGSVADATSELTDAVPEEEAELAENVPDDATTEIDLTETSDDLLIIPGPPPVVPPVRPETASLTENTDTTAGGIALTSLQPGADTDGAAIADFTPPAGAIRPRLRPALPEGVNNAEEISAVLGGIALAQPDPLEGASTLAVAASLRPTSRPTNFDQVVASARSRQQPAPAPAAPEPAPEPTVAAAPAAPPAPATPPPPAQAAAPVAPQNYAPVPGGVARAATQSNAIRLREINLIGVYGQANARRALVRLGNGQFLRVQVGSELDGGQVTAIGDNALNYVKRGTTYALQIPQG